MDSFNLNSAVTILIVLGATVVPYMLGVFLAKAIRMKEYGWKLGLIFTTIVAGLTIIAFGEVKWGIDLDGGVILIYEIDREAAAGGSGGSSVTPGDVAATLRPRLDPGGTGDIVIRPYGDNQIEIIIPKADEDEVENIKELISTSGFLEFLIVVNRADPKHQGLIELAQAQRTAQEASVRQSRFIYVPGKESPQSRWVRLDVTDEKDESERSYRVDPRGSGPQTIVRDGDTGKWIEFAPSDATTFNVPEELVSQRLDDLNQGKINTLQYVRDTLGVDEAEILMATNSSRQVGGDDLDTVRSTVDLTTGTPAVSFDMKPEGSKKMAFLTSNNVDPQDIAVDLYRYMGIVLDGRLLSAPRLQSMISNSGQITGQFTREEVDFLVSILRAGRLKAVLNPNPTSENQIDATLGQATIEKGRIAIGVSLVAVLVFMMFYYRFAGVVACWALVINLVLIVAIMVQFQAAFTLPGLAGLVLTVGMSVDANVLIFERIREERSRGAALRMAIRNGFGKATTTIVDANITTLITAVVLYGIGTDQIRGFALTLIFGILMSMYTAIFCSRVVFDIAEKKRYLSELKMMQLVRSPRLNFIGKRLIAGGVSLVLILIGLVAIIDRGARIFDIDFTGGTSAQIVLKRSMTDAQVRDRVEAQLPAAYDQVIDERIAALPSGNEAAIAHLNSLRRDNVQTTVTGLSDVVDEEGNAYQEGVLWKIDTSIPESDMLQEALAKAFRDAGGESLMELHHLDVSNIREIEASSPPVSSSSDPGSRQPPLGESPAVEPSDEDSPPAEETAPPATPNAGAPPADAPTEPAPPADAPADAIPPANAPTNPPAETADADEAAEAANDTPAAADDPRQAVPRPPVPPSADGARSASAGDLLALAPASSAELALLQNEEPPVAPDDAAEQPAPPAAEAPAESDDAPANAEESVAPAASEEPKGEPADAPLDTDRTSALPLDPTQPSAPVSIEGGVQVTLEFDHAVGGATVLNMIERAAEQLGQEPPRVEFIDPTWNRESKSTHEKWTIQLRLDMQRAEPLVRRLETTINEAPVFLSVSKIGATVAGKTQYLAIASLTASLLGIIAYIWFRFHKVVYGLAAVVALIHDVLITVGAIAVSAYLAPYFGFLLIEEFKISLPIVAALLTIIGYSLNDTIVIFDRIREVKGKNPSLTTEMVNASINQTLSRTMLTSLTTLIVVAILYAMGGAGVHGFAFALMVGVVVGTYSSIFVASPVLLWLTGDKHAKTA